MGTYATAEFNININTRDVLFDNNNRRTLDVFYTNYGTKLFVEDGALIEEKIQRSSTEIHPAYVDHPSYSYSAPEPRDDHRDLDGLREQTISLSNVALKYYNNKHRTHYELVEPVLSNGSLRTRSGIWYHANFTAESSKKNHDGDSSTNFFFAEVRVAGVKDGVAKYSVTACRPLNGDKRTAPCEMCDGYDKVILHPTGRFRQGLYEPKLRNLRPRSWRPTLSRL